MPDPSNDDHRTAMVPATPDPHGQAAYLLTESLLHALIEQSVISRGQAAEIVDVARDVRAELRHDGDGAGETMDRCLALLRGLSLSLRADPIE